MYTVEYYKNKRKKPLIEEPTYIGDRRIDLQRKRKYLHNKDIIDKCWDVKSITIDLEDINHIPYDKRLKKLLGLYIIVNKIELDNNVSSITILNNNKNQDYIYEIIKCEWMINKEDEIEKLDTLGIAKQLYVHIQEYDVENNPNRKKDAEEIIKYYVTSLITRYKNKDNNKVKSLKLGKCFIKDKETNN